MMATPRFGRGLAIGVAAGLLVAMALVAQGAPVGHWRLEGTPGATIGSVPNDVSPGFLDGAGESGERYSADIPAKWIVDPISGSLYDNTSSLDLSTGGRVRVTDDPGLDPTAFTVEGFVKVQNQTSYPNFISRFIANQAGWQLDADPSERARARIDTGVSPLSNQVVGSGSAQSLADYGWHHVALTFDGSQARIYVDYGNMASRAINGDPLKVTQPATDLLFGSSTWPSGSALDEVRYSAGVLTADQFLQTREDLTTLGYWRMHDGASGTQATGIASEVHNDRMASISATSGLTFSHDVPLTAVFDPVAGTKTPNTGSVRIGSGNQFFSIDTATLFHEPGGDFTIEAFVKVDDATAQYQSMIGKQRPGGVAWQLDLRGNADRLALRTDTQDSPNPGDGQFNQCLTSNLDGLIKDNLWHHVAATFDDETDVFRLYVDYLEVGSQTLANGGELFYDGSPLWIGGNFIGNLDEVRLSDALLTPDEFLRAVPEPATLALLGLGALGLLRRRRRTH